MTAGASPDVSRALGVIRSVEAGTITWVRERPERCVRSVAASNYGWRLVAARLDPEARSFVEQLKADLATGRSTNKSLTRRTSGSS